MFKKILVPLDGSENAERVLPWVERYAQATRAQVVILRALDLSFFPDGHFADELFAEAKAYVQRIERMLNREGITSKGVVRAGIASDMIVKTCNSEGCQLIAMTTRGGSDIARWFLGGVTEQVLRLSQVPVLVTRSQTVLSKQARVKKILVPLDGSVLAEEVLPWVEALASFHKAKVLFYHVMPLRQGGVTEEYARMLRTLTDRMLYRTDRLRDRGVVASFEVGQGDAAFEILKKSNDGFDLIATTTRGFGGFKRWIFGSVAQKVIHNANVPVFVFKQAKPSKRSAKEPATAEVKK